jgi:acyl-CoA synthetase (NDP forming)
MICIAVLAEYGGYLTRYHGKTTFEMNWKAKAKPEGDKIIKKALREGRHSLLEFEAKKLFEIHGAPVPKDCPRNCLKFTGPPCQKIAWCRAQMKPFNAPLIWIQMSP